jgi:quinoprotein glucose dehydrogenase
MIHAAPLLFAVEPAREQPYQPNLAPASGEAEKAARAINVPRDLRIEVFAAEPLLANPVAFGFDERGRVYVVETFRLHKGVTDTRSHMDWLDDDMACRTVDDRVAMYRKYAGKTFHDDYEKEHDRVRLLEDRNGDGRADHATVFADGYHGAADGLAAGVLARRGDVWFACIPDLWKLRDTDGDGKADLRQSLHHGYGVHVNFIGHDLHGLRFGPDGKIYFSIGDRGLNVKTADRRLFLPDTGAILRCNPDGSELELFATGLRNPQELAFDRFGNLFTCDNNSDSGDRARWVHLVEGGDSGWRIGYQYIESPVSRGPWNAEKLWNPHFDGQAAYLLPPLKNLADGPSGLTVEPGASLLPERYRHQFFLADFRGSAGQSGVRAIRLKPKGASFEVDTVEQLAWGLEATDVDFGPDGALYISDWVEGWALTGKGRLFKLFDPKMAGNPTALEVKRLLAEGFTHRSADQLARLLSHADARVRQEAQFALAERGKEALAILDGVAKPGHDQLARIHAIWGLGQIGRTDRNAARTLIALLDDRDPEIRSQAAKVVGDLRAEGVASRLVALIRDENPRVRFFAAISLGKVGRKDAIGPLVELLRANADGDLYVRHGAVMGLTGINDVATMMSFAGDSSVAVRTGILLALRRLERPEVERFLNDPSPALVLEAARAIYDVPIAPALPALAAIADRAGTSEPLLRRILNARARLGRPEDAVALAKVATSTLPTPIRVEALTLLRDWTRPTGRDPVVGVWRPRAALSGETAARAFEPVLPKLLKGSSDSIRVAALRAVGPLPVKGVGAELWATFTNRDTWASTRVEALKALERTHDDRLSDAVKCALDDREASVRIEGQRLIATLQPAQAVPLLRKVLEHGSLAEKQAAFATLGGIQGSSPDEVLMEWLGRLERKEVPAEVELDLLEAAHKRSSAPIRKRVEQHELSRPSNDPLSPYREALVGGNAERGWKIVSQKAEVSCVRCHKVRRQGGEVGPDLNGIGKRQDRRYLLESLVMPGKQIAKGFEAVTVALKDGQTLTGVMKSDDSKTLRLITAEAKTIDVPKADIEEQKRGGSAMPDDLLKHLSKAELRDVIEFLASLK